MEVNIVSYPEKQSVTLSLELTYVYPGYHSKLHPDRGEALVLELKSVETLFHCHYSHFCSDLEWSHLWIQGFILDNVLIDLAL